MDAEMRTTIGAREENSKVSVLHITDMQNYAPAMLSSLRRLLRDLPVQPSYRE
jgi:hypothetical protein